MARIARPTACRATTSLDDAILLQLASCPFLRAYDLEKRGGTATATMHRALTRLCRVGLGERVLHAA